MCHRVTYEQRPRSGTGSRLTRAPNNFLSNVSIRISIPGSLCTLLYVYHDSTVKSATATPQAPKRLQSFNFVTRRPVQHRVLHHMVTHSLLKHLSTLGGFTSHTSVETWHKVGSHSRSNYLAVD